MIRMTMTGTVAAMVFALAPGGAMSAQPCAPRGLVVERLAERYGETRRSIGLGADNAVVEIFASEETGTWTITVTMAGGPTCLVASGWAYETLTEPLPPRGDGA